MPLRGNVVGFSIKEKDTIPRTPIIKTCDLLFIHNLKIQFRLILSNIYLVFVLRFTYYLNMRIPENSIAIFAGSIDIRFRNYIFSINKNKYNKLLNDNVNGMRSILQENFVKVKTQLKDFNFQSFKLSSKEIHELRELSITYHILNHVVNGIDLTSETCDCFPCFNNGKMECDCVIDINNIIKSPGENIIISLKTPRTDDTDDIESNHSVSDISIDHSDSVQPQKKKKRNTDDEMKEVREIKLPSQNST